MTEWISDVHVQNTALIVACLVGGLGNLYQAACRVASQRRAEVIAKAATAGPWYVHHDDDRDCMSMVLVSPKPPGTALGLKLLGTEGDT